MDEKFDLHFSHMHTSLIDPVTWQLEWLACGLDILGLPHSFWPSLSKYVRGSFPESVSESVTYLQLVPFLNVIPIDDCKPFLNVIPVDDCKGEESGG